MIRSDLACRTNMRVCRPSTGVISFGTHANGTQAVLEPAGLISEGTTFTASATAPNGWTCTAYDNANAPTLAIRQTTQNGTSCTLNLTVATNDVIVFSAEGW